MIKEYEYLHGVVFNRLCNVFEMELSIKPLNKKGYSAYILNNKAGLYIKYSGKRLTPWRFTFLKSHHEEIEKMYTRFGEVFIALVCYLDGIVMLNYAELKTILDHAHKDSEWLNISRRKNKMYSVTGTDGTLDFKVSKTSCPDKVTAFFKK